MDGFTASLSAALRACSGPTRKPLTGASEGEV
jgi:hypothetical protein